MFLDWRPAPTDQAIVKFIPGERTAGQVKRLVVHAGSMRRGVDRGMPVLRQLLSEPELAGSDLLTFDPVAYNLTSGPAEDFATRLRAEIDARWIRAGGYDDIILTGASLGSILVRQAFLESAGRDPRQPRTIPWSDRVSRIVLLAGIGRGVNPDSLGMWKWIARVGRFVPYVRRSIVYDQLRGAESISGIRIAWIRYFAELNAAAREDLSVRVPIVVQVLGDRDDIVKRADNVDLDQFPNAHYLDVPRARHGDIFAFGPSSDSAARYALFRQAFVSPHPSQAATRVITPDTVQRVIFLLHGLRSSHDNWVRQVGPVLRQRLPNAEIVESSYGLTSLLGFALPSVRRRERLWLQDQYTEALARHPLATIDVIAHSNGTYILGESLEHLPSMRFDRVAILGSVLPTDYSWRARRALGQVGVVRSDRAADDKVVALLASSLHGLGMSDVGTSGWRGFDESAEFLYEAPSVLGGHGATVSAEHLRSVTEFIATGERGTTAANAAQPSIALRVASGLAPWLLFLLAASGAMLATRWIRRATDSRRWSRVAVVGSFALVTAILLDVL